MEDIRGLVQSTLDSAFNGAVYVFWQKASDISGNLDEYIVYTISGDYNREFADDAPLTQEADVTVRYYYPSSYIDTSTGREKTKSRENAILAALKGAAFSCPSGASDAGDIDDVGKYVSVIECSYKRVV